MPKRTETWIQIQPPEGEERIASPDWIVKLLRLDKVKDRIWKLERKIHDLEFPLRRNFILESLKEKPHSIPWFAGNMCDYDFWDLKKMEREGAIEFFRSGTQRMYRLAQRGD